MDEELYAVVHPHSPFPHPSPPHRYEFEVNPIRVDTLVDAVVRFDPVAVDITRIRFLRAEASVNENLLHARRPKRLDGGTKSFQKPSTPRSKAKVSCDFLQSSLMIAGRQRPVSASNGGIKQPPFCQVQAELSTCWLSSDIDIKYRVAVFHIEAQPSPPELPFYLEHSDLNPSPRSSLRADTNSLPERCLSARIRYPQDGVFGSLRIGITTQVREID